MGAHMHRSHTTSGRVARGSAGATTLLASLLLLLAVAAEAQTHSMRQRVFEKLSRAQGLADTGDFTGARDFLQQVEGMKDLTSYEKAQLYTTGGYVAYLQDDLPACIRAYDQVLAQDDLPRGLRNTTLYTLAQLYLQTDQPQACIQALEDWFESADNPGPQPYLLLAQAHVDRQEFAAADAPLTTALRIATQRGQEIPESWLALQRAVLHEIDDVPRLQAVLETLVSRYPQKAYWLHLASVYGRQGADAKQLAVYELAWAAGLLDRAEEIVVLAKLQQQAGVPYRAATVLEAGLASGTLPADAPTHQLRAQMYLLAQEKQQAIDALQAAAALSEGPAIQAELAHSYAMLRAWPKVVSAARRAIEAGAERPEELQLLLGQALFEMNRAHEARPPLQAALRSPRTRDRAQQWLTFIDQETQRRGALD